MKNIGGRGEMMSVWKVCLFFFLSFLLMISIVHKEEDALGADVDHNRKHTIIRQSIKKNIIREGYGSENDDAKKKKCLHRYTKYLNWGIKDDN